MKSLPRKGFTLIELLVVISIISLLSSVVLAAVNQGRDKARLSSIQTNFRSIQNEAELFYASKNKYSLGGQSSLTDQSCVSAPLFGSQIAGTALSQSVASAKVTSSDYLACQVNEGNYAFAIDVSNLKLGYSTYCISNTGNKMYELTKPPQAVFNAACIPYENPDAENPGEGEEDPMAAAIAFYAGLADGQYEAGYGGYCSGGSTYYVTVSGGNVSCDLCPSNEVFVPENGACAAQ